MPIITITLPSVAGVGAITEWLAINYPQSTVTVANDHVGNHLTSTDTDYFWAIERAEANKARFAEDAASYDRVLSMECPFCGAVAGKTCQTTNGTALRWPSSHAARRQALLTLDSNRAVTVLPEWVNDRVTLDEM